MKAAIIISLICAGCFEVASLIGKGLGAQQSVAATAAQIYQQEAP